MTPRVAVVDHRDSFAFVLGDQFARAGAEVATVRCTVGLDAFRAWLRELDPHLVVLSPGPGGPRDTGVTLPWLATDPRVAILGVCLGHQALAAADGGRVERGPEPVHGRASRIEVLPHDLPANTMAGALDEIGEGALGRTVGRYHSLVVTRPGRRQVELARTSSSPAVTMALGRTDRPHVGLQFHPESVLSPRGGPLLEALLARAVLARVADGLEEARR